MYRLIFLLSLVIFGACKPSTAVDNSFEPRVREDFNASNKDRAAWQKPSLVINRLGDLSGKTIADIGAGTGYFAFRFAFKAEKVIAVEIDETMISLMEGIKINLPANLQSKFETRLAEPDNPKLMDEEADIIIMINTLTFINNRPAYLKTLMKGLKTNGKIMLLDYKKDNMPLEDIPPLDDRIDLKSLGDDLLRAGYRNIEMDTTTLDYQFMIIAEK